MQRHSTRTSPQPTRDVDDGVWLEAQDEGEDGGGVRGQVAAEVFLCVARSGSVVDAAREVHTDHEVARSDSGTHDVAADLAV